ncbi:hypothetical protein Cgig2_029080 [Carnegiea gigantea]|uniref:TFIIS N-terminal domain-containing protein n=1 Tax=Carnegiea gigantea TaxID=171969 RepID=A0A9Q1KAB8_9CARY|nr:hypothetical protein Cgig2_029080 [Carnegiea gigantea]
MEGWFSESGVSTEVLALCKMKVELIRSLGSSSGAREHQSNFFTLTEMKDGLTAPARVEELVSVMKKEKDTSVKNFADATRQWAAVASAIAATENKECLDLFIQLDGLWFIDRWLKDVQSFATESSDCFVEEAISTLLQAIERLQIENERLISSGILFTVKSLLTYKSPKVQDRARFLFDSWSAKDVGVTSMDVEKAEIDSDQKLDNEHPVSIADSVLPTLVNDQVGSGEKINDQDSSQIISNRADSKDGCPESVPSPVKLESVQGSVSVRVGCCSSDGNVDKQHFSDTKQGINEAISEILKPEHIMEDTMYDIKMESVPERAGKIQVSSASDSIDNLSSNYAIDAEEAIVKTDLYTNDAKHTLSNKSTPGNDIDRLVAESSNGMKESGDLERKGLDQADGCSVLKGTKDHGTTISRLEDLDGCKEAKRRHKGKSKSQSKSRYFGNTCEFARLTKHGKDTNIIRQTPDMDLENGIVDALEVARLVANEVEREVVGYNEQSGSSSSSSSSSLSSSSSSSSSSSTSESISGDSIGQPHSPESINGGELQTNGPTNELPTMESASPETSQKERLTNSGSQGTTPENHVQDLESSQVTDAVRELETNAERSVCEFDLNQEFSSEDPDHQVDTISKHASIVSASRAVAAPGMPAAPLQFEGTLGWKGSAATSAFRPASPRQASDSDRALSGGGTSSGSRPRQDFLDIDLNVAEGGDDKIVNPMLAKQKELLPGLPSGESSVELSPKKTERLKFDLNQIGDGDVPASEWKKGRQIFGAQNGRCSPSPASSSCIQPSMRNFDLNDNPSNCSDLSHQKPFLGESSSQKVSPCVGISDDSVVSILGTKVKKSTLPPQTPLPFPNDRASEPLVDTSFSRGGSLVGLGPAVPYAQSVYSYNGLAMGPAMPFPSGPMYGPAGLIPYMLDPRGAPVMPQIVGSTSTIPSSCCQPSLVMNLMGSTPLSNTAGPFRPNLDLNSGFVIEGGSRDSSFYRPLFFPGQARPPMEEQLRDNFFRPLSSSGASSGKRKEPDTGWELFPTNYNHHQPPHL